jgi:sugar O-acyltransferase (sialic acid O-acetyltransferase NeuD family)
VSHAARASTLPCAPRDIIILGTGGNCIDILDTLDDCNLDAAANLYRCVGFLDDDQASWGKEVHGVPVLGPLDAAEGFPSASFVNGIGSPANFWHKQRIIAKTKLPLERFATIVHPTASVSRLARLAPGTVVFQNATITSNVEVKQHVIVLPNSIISHDSTVYEFTCIAGGVCISGGVTVGRSCYLGSNCSVINGAEIGDFCLIGMGSVVVRDVPPNSVVVGSPGRVIRSTRTL